MTEMNGKMLRIVIIDKVSFMSDIILNTLDRKLKGIGNQSLPFGGLKIIFAGDFHHLNPLVPKTLNFCSQVYQANIGRTALMQ